MYITEHGNYDGNSWERLCQICFKIKYEKEGYQEVPAWQGDMGIEGYTRTGKVFQCYCPDTQYSQDELYEKQRDKITTDLKKIETYQSDLKDYIKDSKIKEWIFVTPEYRKKDILKHCNVKKEEYRKKKLIILDTKFDVLVYDIDYFIPELSLAQKTLEQKINIKLPRTFDRDVDLTNWEEKSETIDLIANATRKHHKLIPAKAKDIDNKVNIMTEQVVDAYLEGNSILREWSGKYNEQYEKFMEVISMYEKQVKRECIINTDLPNELYEKIIKELRLKLKEVFSYLDSIMIDRLVNLVVADWILRCPIDFE